MITTAELKIVLQQPSVFFLHCEVNSGQVTEAMVTRILPLSSVLARCLSNIQ